MSNWYTGTSRSRLGLVQTGILESLARTQSLLGQNKIKTISKYVTISHRPTSIDVDRLICNSRRYTDPYFVNLLLIIRFFKTTERFQGRYAL